MLNIKDTQNIQKSLQEFFTNSKVIDYLNNNKNIYIAYSGGIDSSVLLHTVHNYIKSHTLSNKLCAIHVNHGISKNADEWLNHCIDTCKKLDIQLYYSTIDITPLKYMGVEAAARTLRYDFLQKIAQNHIVLLAHHAQDQLETFIIQWQRGAGIDGLVSMPYMQVKNNVLYIRPFLNLAKQEIINYAQQYNLEWVEDESNQDTKYTRNNLRHNILPLLTLPTQNTHNTYKSMLHSIKMLQMQKQILDKYLQSLLENILSNLEITDTNNPVNLLAMLALDNPQLIIDWNKFKNIYLNDNNEGILLFRYWLRLHNILIPSYQHIINILSQIFPSNIYNNHLENLIIKYESRYINVYNNNLAIYKQIYLLNNHNKINNIKYVPLSINNVNFLNKNQHEIKINLKELGYDIYYIISISNCNALNIQHINFELSNFKLQNCQTQYTVKIANRPRKTLKHIFQEEKIPPALRNFPVICYQQYVIYHPGFSINLLYKIKQAIPQINNVNITASFN